MKKLRSVIIAILGLMICLTGVPVKSQAPQSFKYQAVVRDRAGQVLPGQDISLQISILQSNTEGPEVYSEMHTVTTSELGIVNIEVGKGKNLAGSFTAIDWSAGNHYLRIEMDPAGGTNFELMGFSQLLSVPYALYADRAGSGERGNDFDWQILGPDVVTGHGGDYPGGYVGVGNNAPQTLLYVAKNMGEPTITIRNLGGGGGATYSMIDDLSGANWKFKATTYGGFKIRDQAWGLDVLTMEPNSAANALYINNLGHVGLGTTTPIEKLSIENGDMYMRDSYPFIFLNNISRGGHTGITFRQNDDYRAWLYFDDYDGLLRLNAEAGGGFRNDLVITSAGKIGIGTPSPEGTFHVSESVSDYTAIFGSDIATFTYGTDVNIGDDNARALLYIGQSYDYKGFNIWAYNATPSNAFYHIGTFQGANPLVFQAEGAIGGKVGIGTTAPQALFHVAQQSSSYTAAFGTPVSTWTSSTNVTIGDDNATTAFYIGQSDDNKGFCNWHYNSTPAGAFYSVGTYAGLNPLILQNAGGNVGIGTQSPASRLHVKFASTDDIFLGYDTEYPAYIYHNETESDGDGQAAIYTYRTRDSRNDGTGYENYSINSAMKGYSFYGDKYSFGTGGFNWNDFTRCGGVIGAEYFGYYWGALGYKTSGSSTYGGYFTSYASGGGKSGQASIGIGIGAWGDLMGADIHGKVYGLYSEGGIYALFSNGPVYKNNLDVHLQQDGIGGHKVLYTHVSTDVTVQTCGTATLSEGKAFIDFDPAFAASVSSEESIVVTVTPTGNSNGVYLAEVSRSGFSVVENNAGRSNVRVNYIAIGQRAGYEHPKLPEEVIDPGYTRNLARGLHNDADLKSNGEGLYYENGKLVVGVHPSTLPDPSKPTLDPNLPKPGTPEKIQQTGPDGPDETGQPDQGIQPKTEKPAIESSSGTGSAQRPAPETKTSIVHPEGVAADGTPLKTDLPSKKE